MATKRQREFRKQMRDIQRNRGRSNENEIYNYRASNYRPRMKSHATRWAIGGGSLLTLAIVAWNIFAASTWIPWISKVIHGTSNTSVSTAAPPSQLQSQSEVISYLKLYTQDLKQVSAIMQEFSSVKISEKYPSSKFQSAETSLNGIEQQLQNESQQVAPVVALGEGLTRDAAQLVTFQETYQKTKGFTYEQKVNQDVEAYNNLLLTQDNKIAQVLQAAHISYQIQPDGTVHYQIPGPIS